MTSYQEELQQRGYIVIPELVPQKLLNPAIEAITQFLDVNLAKPETWYRKPLGTNGIVPLHHHQAFWNIRQYEPLHDLFVELLGKDDLWVRLDRASFKPPWRSEKPDLKDDSDIHIDSYPEDVCLPRLQGILYLTDTAENQGAFSCVPDLYKNKAALKNRHSLTFSKPEMAGKELIPVAAPAGSFILWDSRLPHCSTVNRSQQPRLAQYISMFPAKTEDNREERIELWKRKRAPERWRGQPYQQDPEPGRPAELTTLGKKLLGL